MVSFVGRTKTKKSRSSGDLPFEQDQSTRFLPWIVAPMVFLGIMSLAAVELISAVTKSWDSQVAGIMTVQVPLYDIQDDAEGDGAAADRLDRAVAFIAATPGVESAIALDSEAARSLLEPWLGEATVDLPVPAIIEVSLVAGATLDAEIFGERLGQVVEGAVVDDHRVWLESFVDLADMVMGTALAALVLVMASAAAAVIYATRSGLTVHGWIIELLHHMGAYDEYIARQFQTHVMRLSVRGGLLGMALAGLCLGAVFYSGRGIDTAFLPPLSLSPIQWLILAAVPLASVLIAVVTARITVLRALAKLP